MKSRKGLRGLLRYLRQITIKAIGTAGAAVNGRGRGSIGGRASYGYSTLAGASGGVAFADLERAVDRALDEVIRTTRIAPTPGGGGYLYGGPTGSGGGRMVATATRVAVAPYAVAARLTDRRAQIRTLAGLDGRVSPDQSILARQVKPLLKDIEGAAETIADAAEDDIDEAQSLLKLIHDQVAGILAEVEGPEPPRPPRVNAYLDALGNGSTPGLIRELAEASEVSLTMDIVSPEDEILVTTLRLLMQNAALVAQHWQIYLDAIGTDALGERLAAAQRLLPVIADATATLTAELAAVGFTRREAASAAGDLSTIDSGVPRTTLQGILPDISFDRLLDWMETWTADEGPEALAEGSRHGLERVVDQADALFVVVAGVLANVIALTTNGSATAPRLAAVLSRKRVQPILGRLVGHLDSMAGLA